MKLLKETLEAIRGADQEAMKENRARWDGLFKTIGGLGKLEEISIKLAGMTGSQANKIERKALVVMCADNGVLEEGVSACPQDLTTKLAQSTLNGKTAVGVLSDFTDSDVFVVDMGMVEDLEDPRIINKKVAYGTKNILKEDAMTREELVQALEAGIEIGDRLYSEGYDIIGTGELGMGNTTTSTAIFSALTGLSVEETCGRGAGLTDQQFEVKKRVIKEAIENRQADRQDIMDIMSKLGGFDIAGICGLYLSAAKNRKPIVIDGFISSAAALCASKLNVHTKDFMLASHLSKEPGAGSLLEELEIAPMLDMDMRLGEGTGCPITFKILETSLYVLENMATFKDWELESSILVDIR